MDAPSPIDVHYLIWRDQTMAVAHHVAEQTNRLFRGQLELIHTHPRLQRYWDWMHREFSEAGGSSDESIPMCAFIFEKWSVEFPDGSVLRSELPMPDIDYKMVTWRLRA